VTAGAGTDSYRQALDLERLLTERFGENFRNKAIVNAGGVFRLRDAFEECGLPDPRGQRDSGAYGLWQFYTP
jgi:hypothetical protein